MTELNAAINPRLAAVYDRCALLLTKRGRQIVDRAVKKGTVGGDVGMQMLLEPAMLLSLVADTDAMFELAEAAKSIPFIGNYNQWLPASATTGAAYRVLTRGRSTCARRRVVAVAPRARWPSRSDGQPLGWSAHRADPTRRLLAAVEAAAVLLCDREAAELSVMWAFGGSETWPRERIDEAIEAVKVQVADSWRRRDRPGVERPSTSASCTTGSGARRRAGAARRRRRAKRLRHRSRLHPGVAAAGGRGLDSFREPGSDAVAETIFVFGCYIGEVLVRNADYQWVRTPPEVARMFMPLTVFRASTVSRVNPIGKAFKRVDNGPIDDIPYFYQLFSGVDL